MSIASIPDNASMRIDVCNERGRRVATVEVDPARPPSVVHGVSAAGEREEHYLDWDRALDDEGQLRKCPVCNCVDLFRRSVMPALTGFVVVLAVGLICLALWGLTDAPLGWMAAVLGVVIVANALIVWRAPRYLACYRCGSRYYGVRIGRDRDEWDATVAERYRGQAAPPRPSGPSVDDAAEDAV